MSRGVRTFLLWVLLVVLFGAIYMVLDTGDDTATESVAAFYADIDAGRVTHVTVDHESRVYAELVNGTEVRITGTGYTDPVADRLEQAGVTVEWRAEQPSGGGTSGTTWLFVLGGVVLLLVVFVFVLRRIQGQSVLGLRKTTARLVSDTPKVGWDDVGGSPEAKAYLRDTVDFLKSPGRWEAAGARTPRGVLLEGPPGYGKTMLAKALAGEAKLPFFEVSGSEFVELFVGVGAARVRDLFDEAKKKAPCVVFIDEFDAIGRKRGGGGATLTHQEREQALDQLLVCLDGFAGRARVVVVAATNRADVLDPALLRPGRFDITLRVGDFSAEDRRTVLGVHLKNKPTVKDLDLAAIASIAHQASGADLEQICNMAAMAVARRGEATPKITQADLEKAARSLVPKSSQLDKLDVVLAAASSGVAQPDTQLDVVVTTRSSGKHEGRLVWADPFSLKVATSTGGVVISRGDVAAISASGDVAPVGVHDVLRVASTQQPDAG